MSEHGTLSLIVRLNSRYQNCNRNKSSLIIINQNKFLGDRFEITVESVYLPNDRGEQYNVLNLPNDVLKKRIVEILDIAKDQIDDQDFTSDYDPKAFHSSKTYRGPLTESWMVSSNHYYYLCNYLFKIDFEGPTMCCYKLVTIKFHIFGFENKVQQYIDKVNQVKLLS